MERTLSQRELNRALLARQLLLERSPAPLPRALERVGGIQAQYAPSMYFGLWSRLRGIDRDTAEREQAETDHAREAYVRHFYGADARDPAHYHMVIDSTRLPVGCVVEAICAALRR